MSVNRGFELMIPKREKKPTSPQYKNQIRIKLFNRVFCLTLEVKGDE